MYGMNEYLIIAHDMEKVRLLARKARIKFADATVTATQAASLASEVALAGQPAVDERLPESSGAELEGPTEADVLRRR